MISDRLKNLEESSIRKIFALAAENKGEYVNLSIGQPHFNTSETLKNACIKAIEENKNNYTATPGLLTLREKISQKLIKDNNIKAKADNIIVSSGASAIIFLALSAILDPGDELIIPEPYFVSYKQLGLFLGAKLVFLDTYPDFHLDINKINNLITPKTKAIIINSPNNPTGAVYTKSELEELAELARKNNLMIISDEVYEKYDYEKKFFSIGSIYDNTLTINAFSKSHSVTGWRVGYAHGPSEIIQAMSKLQQYTFVCAPSIAQSALIDSFSSGLEEEYENYRCNRDYLVMELKDIYEFSIPEGAFYAFIKTPQGRGKFIEELIENKLLVVPSSAFSARNDYFRLSFATDIKILKKGITILKKLA